MTRRFIQLCAAALAFGIFWIYFGVPSIPKANAQNHAQRTPPAPGPMLAEGFINSSTPDFQLSLVRSSQTVAALEPKDGNGFDFTPSDLLVRRSQDGYVHLGDIDLRLRVGDEGDWQPYSTWAGRQPVKAMPASGNILAAADLAPTLPANIPLNIKRIWALEKGKLVLRFILQNKGARPVQIGSLGIPMVFNNVLTHRTLPEAHAKCSFYDPYIGEDAGYLQVTRLSGLGPALVIVPDGGTSFEAYNPILNPWDGRFGPRPIFSDPTPRSNTFEGFYEWMVLSKAYADNQWKDAQPWNPPTMLTLAPGRTRTYALKFLRSDSIRGIENTLIENRRPVAVGIPGYVLPMGMHARLFLNYPKRIASMTIEPAGAIAVHKDKPPSAGWKAYTLNGMTWGRSRLTITYRDGLVQTINYFVTKPEAQVAADLGSFLTTEQWFVDPNDPFHRSPSVMSYDRSVNRIVTQDSRVWIAGLSDEGGAGSWLAAIMKEFGQPKKEEMDKFQQFVDGVLWGHLQYSGGAHEYGVRKSLFYYQPDELPPQYYASNLNWHSWTSWNKEQSEAVDRSYDYPHVAAAYWVMYRLARYHQGLVTDHPWRWYLIQAYETSMAMTKYASGLAQFGQMEGTVFVKILSDLKREGMEQQAGLLEAAMRRRADHWREKPYPFGSEMPWDSTGQEEVYAWMRYFGFREKARITLDAILGYDSTIPNWGYNGSGPHWWDFLYAGKIPRLQRQLHHYGSGLNAIPLLAEYRRHPDDFYLLQAGYGGTMGVLTDIDQQGFESCAFHSFPDMLKFDPYSGDNGPNFFGFALNSATYIVHHPQFGWLAFGGNIEASGDEVRVTPLDAFRRRAYIAPVGLWLTLDAGQFNHVEFNSKTEVVRVGLAAATSSTPAAYLRVRQPGQVQGAAQDQPLAKLKIERGAYVVPLGTTTTWIELGRAR